MLIDLARNDAGKVCAPGTVQVHNRETVERFSHVMHIVSDVLGELRPECTSLDALLAGFPAGTLTGAPKIRAMQIIAGLEKMPRGPYGGAVGYFGFNGDIDTCINIRSMLVKNGMAHFWSGAGIVADSQASTEYQETMYKARAISAALTLLRNNHHINGGRP